MRIYAVRCLLLVATAMILGCATPAGDRGERVVAAAAPRYSPTPCSAEAQDHRIEITARHNSCEHAYVSKRDGNQILWFCAPSCKQLDITFTTTNPFEFFKCRDTWCLGVLPKDLPDYTEYPYLATIDGNKASDPNVIIKP